MEIPVAVEDDAAAEVDVVLRVELLVNAVDNLEIAQVIVGQAGPGYDCVSDGVPVGVALRLRVGEVDPAVRVVVGVQGHVHQSTLACGKHRGHAPNRLRQRITLRAWIDNPEAALLLGHQQPAVRQEGQSPRIEAAGHQLLAKAVPRRVEQARLPVCGRSGAERCQRAEENQPELTHVTPPSWLRLLRA